MPKPCDHDSRPLYEKLIEPLREVAKANGYCLAVHGTLKRDIDLVAVPWVAQCSHPCILAEEIMKKCAELNGGIAFQKPGEDTFWFVNGCPGMKPHGRLVWSIHLGGGPYIDLSVVPGGNGG